MKITPAGIEKFLALLAETPDRMTVLTHGLDDAHLRMAPGPGEWSIVDILSHLRSCADVWGGIIAAMLSDNEPALEEIHPRTWQKKAGYEKFPFNESLRQFMTQRQELLGQLRCLSFEQWERGAVIGKRRHTVFNQARRMALHEQDHLGQIEDLPDR